LIFNFVKVFVAFFIGVFLFWLYDYLKGSVKLKNYFSVISLIIIAVFIFYLIKGQGYQYIASNLARYQIIIIVLFFPSIILSVLNINILRKFLSLGIFRWLGNLSFSVYLWHYPIFIFLSYVHRHINFNIESKKVMLLVLAFCLLISHFSYYFLEVPVQKFIRNKYYKYKAEKVEKSVTVPETV
jgi:peptidoglycan/LPS O-acetylase OafA/YrhL